MHTNVYELTPMPPSSTRTSLTYFGLLVLVYLGICGASLCEATELPTLIPLDRITALETELTQGMRAKSKTRIRRAYKSVTRKAAALHKAHSTSPNRYAVLAVQLKGQRLLLRLENNERNRAAMFETCRKLMDAPDKYSEFRLDADLLLSARDLVQKDASAKERVEALSKTIEKYRDTPAEIKCLIIATGIASQLGAYEIKKDITVQLKERFPGAPRAITHRKKLSGGGRLDVLFAGAYERIDGVKLSFPIDRMGRPFVTLFWSKSNPDFKAYLQQVKEQQKLFPGQYEIFSFNLDELPDAGLSILRDMGLQCTVMRLPGGKTSKAFITYGQRDPNAVAFNHVGRTDLLPIETFQAEDRVKKGQVEVGRFHGARADWTFKYPRAVQSHYRYGMQLQSIFTGDFLALDKSSIPEGKRPAQAVPADALRALQSGFTGIPKRYRLTSAQAVAGYKKVADDCERTIVKYPKDPELWRVRNFHIVALLGLWVSSGEPEYLEQAVGLARKLVARSLPGDDQVISRYCLAKHSLRQGDRPTAVLSDFIEATGGDNASGSALAAAAILAIDAGMPGLHAHYRERFLTRHGDSPNLVPAVSFLRNRYHTLHLFKSRALLIFDAYEYKYSIRRYLIDNDIHEATSPLPKIKLTALDGGTLSLPEKTTDAMTILVFIEPGPSGNTDLPGHIYSPPTVATKERGGNRVQSGYMVEVANMAKNHVNKEMKVVFAFLSDDIKHVKAIKDRYKWPWQIALVPGGLQNPLVQKLDILSADRIPNTFLIRRNGTVAWSARGLVYAGMAGQILRMNTALLCNIARLEVEAGYRELKIDNAKKALKFFSGPFPFVAVDPKRRRRNWEKPTHKWHSSRLHGRALVHMRLNKPEDALADINIAITEHTVNFRHNVDRPCSSMAHMERTKAKILDALGRKAEARASRKRASEPIPYPTDYLRILGYNEPYEHFQDKLINWTSQREGRSFTSPAHSPTPPSRDVPK